MNFTLIREILNDLEQIHTDFRNNISFKRKNKKLAIYIITGRILTHCEAITNLLQNGFFVEAGILIRSVYEAVYVAEYFYMVDSNSTDLRKWFNDEIISPSKARKAQFKLNKLLSELIGEAMYSSKIAHRQLELVNKIYKVLSKYTHPTYNISKINMDHRDFEFNYKGENIRRITRPLPYSFEETVILVINMICTCFDILGTSTFAKLRHYVSLLEQNT